MHDSEQEHRGITGCRVTYESTIFYNEANKFSIIVVKTSDPRIPPQACNGRYYGDRMLRFTAVGYELPRTKAVELELDGEWVENKYGYQLQVEQWQEIVPQTADGLLAYLGSGLIKGIGPKTAENIVATFGPDTLNILDNSPEKLLQIRGITEGKLKDIEESYAESRVLRNLMSLLGPFKITPATALKIYQHFGPACVDILKKCPYDLCQISGFGFKRVDGIVRKTDNRLHSTERIKGAVLYTLEDARSKSGHLFLPAEDLTKETLLLLNAPIPIPEQRVRTEEVQETLQQMILHGAVVAYKQYLYSPRVFGQEDDTARMIAERLAYISVAENIESSLESVRESLGIQSMQQLHEKIADMNTRYYDLRGKIVKAERRIATLTERGEMWEQYNQYKSIHKQLAKVKPEKREQFEQRHSRELILYDAAARYLKELKDSGEGITPKAWHREIDQLAAEKQADTLAMKSMREDLKAVERLRKTAEQLSRQERDKSHDREPER